LKPVTINAKWCKKCGICAAFCPKKVFDTGDDGAPCVARPEDCIRCRLCELRCPDFAIKVEEVK
jgi:2-oxoglutarate ferredoxin oxidoreductase subunit delta